MASICRLARGIPTSTCIFGPSLNINTINMFTSLCFKMLNISMQW